MSRARPAVEALSKGHIKGPIFRRNLIAIFQGRQPTAIDSPQVRARKIKRTQRCQVLRNLGPAVILTWGVSIPPSTWEEMDLRVFNDVLKQMTNEVVTDLPRGVQTIVSALGREEPLNSIAAFGDFVRGESSFDDCGR